MKKIKLLFWLVVVAIIALGIYQNLALLKSQHALKLDFWAIGPFTAELSFGVILLGFFLAGLLIAYFFSLAHRFKTRKNIRRLSEDLEAERKKVAELEARLGPQPRKSGEGASESGTRTPASAPAADQASEEEKTGNSEA